MRDLSGLKKGQGWNRGLNNFLDGKLCPLCKRIKSSTKEHICKPRTPWNKGLKKEDDPRIMGVSIALTGIKRDEVSIEKSRINAGKRIREQYKNGERKWWGLDPKNKEIWEKVSEKFGNEDSRIKAFRANAKHSKNKLETIVEKILNNNYPGVWKFVGDGKKRIGTKFPDFIHSQEKYVILVNGVYWHTFPYRKDYKNKTRQQIEEIESAPYRQHNYVVIFIWEDEVVNIKNGKPIELPDHKLIVDKLDKYGILCTAL